MKLENHLGLAPLARYSWFDLGRNCAGARCDRIGERIAVHRRVSLSRSFLVMRRMPTSSSIRYNREDNRPYWSRSIFWPSLMRASNCSKATSVAAARRQIEICASLKTSEPPKPLACAKIRLFHRLAHTVRPSPPSANKLHPVVTLHGRRPPRVRIGVILTRPRSATFNEFLTDISRRS
jgi:hypothetical protein